ncbi:hypothetical protein A4U53_003885 (plasmid) [Rhizobium ruizarguesonis]|uniref:Uncharacterized protein n=2 Tax=Rhizobium TaxID=379 RepID=A0A179B9S1_RHILE|nr:hypothetical protein [Rhizobium leguminosarum]OAP88109.1 hypothetical protein A4U53_35530 [Rhizobium leguminosarum]
MAGGAPGFCQKAIRAQVGRTPFIMRLEPMKETTGDHPGAAVEPSTATLVDHVVWNAESMAFPASAEEADALSEMALLRGSPGD